MCTSLKKKKSLKHPFLNLTQGLGLPWSSFSFFDNVIALVQLIHNAKN